MCHILISAGFGREAWASRPDESSKHAKAT
jgi:hypothetical protein